MDFDGDTATIVQNGDQAVLSIDCDFDIVHIWIADFVISGIDQDFIKNLVETWYNLDIPKLDNSRRLILENHYLLFRVVHPHLHTLRFGGANVL